MEQHTKPSPNKEIRNLLTVIGGSIVFGFIFAGMVLYYYGPSGRYYAKNVLFSPSLYQKIADADPKKKGAKTYVFKDINFAYYNPSKKQVKQVHVPLAAYEEFYHAIEGEKSEAVITNEITSLFDRPNTSKLTLEVESKGESQSSSGNQSPFIVVDFAYEGDYYRVKLRQEGSNEQWAYFHSPHIYSRALNIFTHQR